MTPATNKAELFGRNFIVDSLKTDTVNATILVAAREFRSNGARRGCLLV